MISEEQFIKETQSLSDTMFRLSLSILRQEADCRDAVQTALVKAWEARKRVEPDRFRPYLTRILINECRNIQRQRMRVTPMADLPDTQAHWTPEESELGAAIALLPESIRTPLLLFYMEGFSEKQTALALNIPVTAVKNRLYRARKALKKRLEDWEVSDK